jgi:hypothetical protein
MESIDHPPDQLLVPLALRLCLHERGDPAILGYQVGGECRATV